MRNALYLTADNLLPATIQGGLQVITQFFFGGIKLIPQALREISLFAETQGGYGGKDGFDCGAHDRMKDDLRIPYCGGQLKAQT